MFVRGLWLHADSWSNWADLFRDAGYAPTVPGWPGGRIHRRGDAQAGGPHRRPRHRRRVVRHHAQIIETLGRKPIVIGHSFGGLIAQRLLGEGRAAAAVGIDAAPIKGVVRLPPSALRVASVALRNPANRKRAVSLTREQFRYGFGNALPRESAFANFSPSSPAKVDTENATRGPLLLTAGGKDHTVPAAITRSTLKLYRKSSAVTDYEEFSDRGHTLAADGGWREIADSVLAWLKAHSL